MTDLTKPTHNEHYVPKHILKNWESKNNKTNQPIYYLLDTKTLTINHKYSVKNFGYKYNMYEMLKQNNIIDGTENALEKGLGLIETRQGMIIKKIKQGLDLSNDECTFLILCTISQMLRVPKVLEVIENALYKTSKQLNEPVSEDDIKNIAKLIAVPISRIKVDESITQYYIRLIYDISKKYFYILTIKPIVNLQNYSFVCGQDIPVVSITEIFSKNKSNNVLYFPISPRHCLIFSDTYIQDELYVYININKINGINLVLFEKNDLLLGYKECLENLKENMNNNKIRQ